MAAGLGGHFNLAAVPPDQAELSQVKVEPDEWSVLALGTALNVELALSCPARPAPSHATKLQEEVPQWPEELKTSQAFGEG